MLTHICLENFKAYKARTELHLAPITLLYGPNSSGKSSIIQALMYAYEVIANDWLDVDQCSLSPIGLGGYWNVLNNQADFKDITFGFGYTLDENPVATKAQREFGKMSIEALESYEYWTDAVVSSPNGAAGPKWGYVEFTLSWSEQLNKPYVSKLGIYLQNDASTVHSDSKISPRDKQQHILDVVSEPSRQQVYITNINFEHDLFFYSSEEELELHPLEILLKEMDVSVDPDNDALLIPLNGMRHNAKPRLGKALELSLMADRLEEISENLAELHFSKDKDLEKKRSQLDTEQREIQANLAFLTELFSQFVITPLHHVSTTIKHMAHIGPWRDIPERNFMPSRSHDSRRWYKGLAAWDEVYQCSESQFKLVSDWMQRLKTGYSMAREDIDSRSTISTAVNLKDLSNNSRQPADIGVGISQLFPIVVAACSQRVGMVFVEQPELHIHPALQVEFGDLFCGMASLYLHLDNRLEYEEYLTGVMGPPGCKFLIETHSEHILLRLLRRIRETSDEECLDAPYRLYPHEVNVLYISQENGQTTAKNLRISEDGDFLDEWPKGFFEERAEELF